MPKAANPATQGVVSAALADTDAISAPLVSYLKRLRDLDETASGLTASIKRAVDAKLEEAREGKDDGKRARGETAERRTDHITVDSNHGIEVMTARCVSVCDEKVAVAQQCYDLVEQHIARLDKDLRVFDQALAEKEAAAAVAKGLVPPPTAASVGGAGLASPEPAPQLGIAAGASRNAPNPDEPKYCVCNRVSFGEMIACENEACAVEWFHFACVGLSTDAKIKGKWYCNACAAERRRLKKLEAKANEKAK
jgi:inhibitor of growth protein 4